MKAVNRPFVLAILAAGAPILLSAIELQPNTLQAWDDYISTADSRMQARLDGQRPFLWTDEVPERRSRLQRGEVGAVESDAGQAELGAGVARIGSQRGFVAQPRSVEVARGEERVSWDGCIRRQQRRSGLRRKRGPGRRLAAHPG